MTHEERDEHNDDDKLSDGDPKVDFAALAVSYHTIDVRHDSTQYSDESSDDSSTHRGLIDASTLTNDLRRVKYSVMS